MNFTREPIIETVITPREGCKLVVRSSKGASQDEYSVDAVEVISFGCSHFFRSIERTNAFLVPVTDYEVVELKEMRVALKNASLERSIKIGGGRETLVRSQPVREMPDASDAIAETSSSTESQAENKKRDRRRRRRRGGHESRFEGAPQATPPSEEQVSQTENGEEAPPAPAFISRLFPPPPTLIKETLGRYKLTEEVVNTPEHTFPEDLEAPTVEPVLPDEESDLDE